MSARLGAAVVLGLSLAACSDAAPSDEATGASSSALTLKSYPYDRPKQSHADLCAPIVADAKGNRIAPLRFADGTVTGHAIADFALQPTPGSRTIICPAGYARLDAREILETPNGRPMLFHRGGWGYVGGDGGGVRYGNVLVSDLEASHAVKWDKQKGAFVPAKLEPWTTPAMEGETGNGAACKGPFVDYETKVEAVPDTLRYLGSTPWNVTSYKNYGDAAVDPEGDGTIKYTMLSWSWIDVQGGGVARAVVADGARFHRCKDVRSKRFFTYDKATWRLENGKPVEIPEGDPTKGHRNGWVQAVYGAIDGGKGRVFGWMTYAHQECTTGIARDAKGQPACASGSPAPVLHLVRR
jgi:hypothetical protein